MTQSIASSNIIEKSFKVLPFSKSFIPEALS
uniref:Uncharacterized protein n=1 Tax=Siphoviridae sp. ctdYc1 TaxID=2826399 RepID=A0A8S5N0C4_9CAUD|nr:MAG TPA: hypothetical protein [Siphoviridae sp. ctdYc1]